MRKPPTRLKKTIGWLLSAFLLVVYFSPQAQLLRTLPARLSVAVGQQAVLDAPFPLTVEAGEDVSAGASLDETLEEGAGTSTATISFLGLLPLREVKIDISDDLRLYPGGQAVGVALHTQGVLVVGTSDLSGAYSPARLAGVKAGDLITRAGGKPLESAAQLTEMVAAMGDAPLPLTIQRGNSTLEVTLTPQRDGQSGDYRIGAWVRDSTAGVGTLSFYGALEEGGDTRFGALGHAITDSDTQQVLTVGRGQIMQADVVDVRKGEAGFPGELKGSFLRENRVLGDIFVNNQYGIYGELEEIPEHPLYPDGVPIGRRDAVHTGPATILSTVGTDGMREYDVEIVEVARQSQPAQRSMVLRVTDPELLKRTGGIVQGMSGSPILQDGRLIGAVTHVWVNP